MKIEYLTEIEGQMSIDDLLREQQKPEYGSRGCNACWWFRENVGRCQWAIDRDYTRAGKAKIDYKYPVCGADFAGTFEPSPYRVPKMCGNCKWANEFCYKNKPEYAAELAKNNGYTRRAADDPLEEPNIYCTHPQGSLNRRTEYKDLEWAGFGVGHWNRQHEWDTCDRWEMERGGYRKFDFEEERKKQND